MKQPIKISFSTQKGGVGKSTLTSMMASILHYRLGYNVLVVDCDFPQHSLSKMRQRDLKSVMENPYHKKAAMQQFQTINKKAYGIIKCKAEEALDKTSDFLSTTAVVPDLVLFDLPGTANTRGVLSTLKMMDYIFSPITADRFIVESTLSFTKAFLTIPSSQGSEPNPSIWLFWNLVDGRERTGLYDAYQEVINELGLTVMKSKISESKKFRKESDDTPKYVFRSTLLPADQKLMAAANLDSFVEEFLRIIKL